MPLSAWIPFRPFFPGVVDIGAKKLRLRHFSQTVICLTSYKNWTAEEDAECRKLHQAGWSSKDVATHLGRTYRSVRNRLRRPQASFRPDFQPGNRLFSAEERAKYKALRAAGSSWHDIQAAFPERSIHTLYGLQRADTWTDRSHAAANSRRRWTPTEDAELLRLRNEEQLTLLQAARKLCRTGWSVVYRYKTLSAAQNSSKTRLWTEDEVAILKKLKAGRLPVKDIAARLDRSVSSVYGKWFMILHAPSKQTIPSGLGSRNDIENVA